ncbi:MAG: response regulator [Pyrinomonadaceae bacterium]
MSASSNARPHNATLLIVDDEESVRHLLCHVFDTAGYRTLPAADAPSALSLLHREHCDLVVLDIAMPGVNGLALCRLLRAQSTTRELPIVIFTASNDEKQKEEAFAAGADDYIVKPSSPRELLSRVNTHLKVAQRERALLGSNRELLFLADLGRGLLQALEPEQVMRRVAGATYEGTGAALCAAAINLSGEGAAVCVFDREGSAEDSSLLHVDRLSAWLSSADAASSAFLEDPKQFFIRDAEHRVEYAAPFRFSGRTQGALIVAFDKPDECGETECRIVDAAAQQAALASHISSLYAASRASSVNLAKEVEHRTAEVEEQRRFTEAIIDSLPVSLYAVDRDYRIVAWNRNRELGSLGLPRNVVMGRNIFEVLTKQKREVLEREIERAFETGEIERIGQETTTPEGETRHWLISKVPMRAEEGGEVTHVITVGEEITQRVEANRAVARAEKLAAVGRLAAGVVHEINNPLATISACAEALESRVQEGAFDASSEVEDLREYLGLIRSEAFRCKQITNGLLNFSRARAAGVHTPVYVPDIITSAARLVVHQKRGEAVEIQVEVADDVQPVNGDEGQLQQAVIALATNAIDAMPEGGRLTFRARNENGNVLIEVSDTGVGIADENLTKIFDPFFTTKEVGRGTGLGLAVCYGIVTEHDGRLDVQSALGVGTTFTISLPPLAANNGEERA